MLTFQRGTNENWNGMIRRMFHKGFDFNSISQVQLDDVVNANKWNANVKFWIGKNQLNYLS